MSGGTDQESVARQMSACRLGDGRGADISVETILSPDQIHPTQLTHRLAALLITSHLLSALLAISLKHWCKKEYTHSNTCGGTRSKGCLAKQQVSTNDVSTKNKKRMLHNTMGWLRKSPYMLPITSSKNKQPMENGDVAIRQATPSVQCDRGYIQFCRV